MVLLFSIANVVIDIVSSLAMNNGREWWMYEYAMTLYVASMPLLAAVWVCYAYVLIHRDGTHQEILRGIVGIVLPYLIFVAVAISNPYTEWFFHLTEDMQYSRSAILMDVCMPVMDGIEATKRIRALSRADAKSVPIIAMTADAFAEERKRTLESGMNYHLSKPIEAKLLERVLCEYVKKRAAE